jgi:transposase InsO family protein
MTIPAWPTPKSMTMRPPRPWSHSGPRAVAFYATHGITVRDVFTDNGPSYHATAWARANATAGIKARRTRRYRTQTNRKVERYQRTLRDEWGYAKAYQSESAGHAALTIWVHIYNHHRPHTAFGGRPPITRVTNFPFPGQSN